MQFKEWLKLAEGGMISDKSAQLSRFKPGPHDVKHKPHDDIHICGASGGPAPCQGNSSIMTQASPVKR